jgi:Fe-S-cluster containining protein
MPFRHPRSGRGARYGEIPEWSKGADCKSVGYAFEGSNPSLPRGPSACRREGPSCLGEHLMPETDLLYRDGLRFACTRCSRCCRHTPGYVFLSARDLDRVSRALGVDTAEARRRYCRTVRIGQFTRVSLQEKPNLDCILWEDEGCSVYASRPLQCRSFPFWSSNLASRESWEEQAAACPGIGRGRLHGRARIQRWLARRIADPLLGE